MIPNNDKKRSYSVVYLPKVEGLHKVRTQTHLVSGEPVFNRQSDQLLTGPSSPGSSPPQLKVLFAGQDIDRSPFNVHVSKALGDPNKVQARGPGLEPQGNVANKPTYFDIYTAGEAPGAWDATAGLMETSILSVAVRTSSLEPKYQDTQTSTRSMSLVNANRPISQSDMGIN